MPERGSDPIFVEGPWEHKTVYAHGARFHVAVQGSGPLVLFLHGFPTFWWLWRRILGPVAEAGYTAAAMDLRGYGGTDHPPRGYDPRTLAADVAGVINTLGHNDAIIVGHGWGGLIAWTAATLQSKVVRGISVIGAAHPNALRKAMLVSPAQTRALAYVVAMQRPWIAERSMSKNNAAAVGDILRSWMPSGELDDDIESQYRSAFLLGNTAHCALEYHRWALRSIPRLDGRSFAKSMDVEIDCPVLQIHGEDDSSILVETAYGSEDFVSGPFEFHELPGAGHLIPESHAAELEELLVEWLANLSNDDN